jgi:hypothetical protein
MQSGEVEADDSTPFNHPQDEVIFVPEVAGEMEELESERIEEAA